MKNMQKLQIIRAIKMIVNQQQVNIRILDIMTIANRSLDESQKLDRKTTMRLLVEILDKSAS